MELGDDRGQAVQVGAVLLFAVLILLLSFYQASVVPSENEEVEYNDFQEATADVSHLRNAIVRSAADDVTVGVTVRTGSQYPARVLFVNPAPAQGRLRTTDARTVRIANATAVDAEPENVGEFWDGDLHTLSHRNVAFAPNYNEFRAAPIRIEQGYAYRAYDDPVSVTPQTLVQGNRITLVTVAGDLGTGGYTASVTVEPVSANGRTVTVTSDGPLNITVPTALPASVWEERILADQFDPPGDPDHPDRYVQSVTDVPGENAVNITLEPNETYELRLGRVELRRSDDDATVETPPARYVTHVGDDVVEDGDDSRAKLVVEARDRFDNPRSNANVTFDASSGRFEDADGDVLGTGDVTVRTDSEGKAVVWYNASAGVYEVDAYLGDEVDQSLPAEQKLEFTVVSSASGGGGAGGGGSGEGSSFILLEDTDTSNRSDGNVTLTLNNTGDASLNLTGIQLAHVTNIKGDPSDGPNQIVRFTLNGETRSVNATESLRAKFFRSRPVEFEAGLNDITLSFDEKYDQQVMLRFHLYFEGGVTAVFDLVIFKESNPAGGNSNSLGHESPIRPPSARYSPPSAPSDSSSTLSKSPTRATSPSTTLSL